MVLISAFGIFASAAAAQNPPPLSYGSIRTPEIQLGSDITPTVITVPPVIEVSGPPAEPRVSNAPPASTKELATRHFDFIVSPIAQNYSTRGSMEDTSISLGEYARQLRAQKQAEVHRATPDAMAQPATAK